MSYNLYQINNDSVKASNHGGPQMRTRYIFNVKEDKSIRWDFSDLEDEINLKDAIGNLPKVDPLLREGLGFTVNKFQNFLKGKKLL